MMEPMVHAAEVSTEGWTEKVHQHPLPDYSRIAREAYLERGHAWPQDPAARPWFDQAGASERVAAMRREGLLTEEEEQYLVQWVDEGYFVVKGAIDESQFDLLDRYNRGLDDVWTAPEVFDGLQVSGLRVDGIKRSPIPHAELLSWPLEKRIHLRDTETWRIHYYQPFTPAGIEIAKSRRLVRLISLLLEQNPVLLNLTTYKYSSEVALHQDMWFYHLHPANHMVGIWLACEDVSMETGPLAVYPGSQKEPMWPGFPNYPQTNYRTCHPAVYEDIENYLRQHVAGKPRVILPVKKGDAIFLNGLLVHDAEKVQKRGVHSRFSIVLHYTVPGVNKFDEVEGPFNY
jgi:phytanoyl-CoA hydroxylase